jgi:hypothetical protein
MADELRPEDCWEYEDPMFRCDKNDPYKGPHKVYPARHGVDCPGHKDWNYHSDLWWSRDPDRRPLPKPQKWWGYTDEIVNVDPRYL